MLKKLFCLLLCAVLCLGAACACAEDGEQRFTLGFEEGFRLTLPEGWVSYPVQDPVIRYALGDGSGQHFMYILIQPCDFADFDQMRAAIDARGDCGKTNALDLNGLPFAAFIAPDLNASGCATLLDGQTLSFLFTPQDDSEYMVTVARIMASFRMKL